MPYRVLIFNKRVISLNMEDSLLKAITETSFNTLCEQYCLDPDVIKSVRDHLAVHIVKSNTASVLFINYLQAGKNPIVIERWNVNNGPGEDLLHEAILNVSSARIREEIQATRVIFSVNLRERQLKDAGLLLAYEVARWAAEQGQGIVRGLDGIWYQLNRYKAFIPIKN